MGKDDSYTCMYLIPQFDYDLYKNGDRQSGGGDVSQVNNIEVGHGGNVTIRDDRVLDEGVGTTTMTRVNSLGSHRDQAQAQDDLAFAPFVGDAATNFVDPLSLQHPALREGDKTPFYDKKKRQKMQDEERKDKQIGYIRDRSVQATVPSSAVLKASKPFSSQASEQKDYGDLVASNIGPERPMPIEDNDVDMEDVSNMDVVAAVKRARAIRNQEEENKKKKMMEENAFVPTKKDRSGLKARRQMKTQNLHDVEMKEVGPDQEPLPQSSSLLPPSLPSSTSNLSSSPPAPVSSSTISPEISNSLSSPSVPASPSTISLGKKETSVKKNKSKVQPILKAKRRVPDGAEEEEGEGEMRIKQRATSLLKRKTNGDDVSYPLVKYGREGDERASDVNMMEVVARRLRQLRGPKRTAKVRNVQRSSLLAPTNLQAIGYDPRDIVYRPSDVEINNASSILGLPTTVKRRAASSGSTSSGDSATVTRRSRKRGRQLPTIRRDVLPPIPLPYRDLQPPQLSDNVVNRLLALTWQPERSELKRRRHETKLGRTQAEKGLVSDRKKIRESLIFPQKRKSIYDSLQGEQKKRRSYNDEENDAVVDRSREEEREEEEEQR